MADDLRDLDRFYALLALLEERPSQGHRLADCVGGSVWPSRGVYFFREPGETRTASAIPRVVRVGTHAVSVNSKSTLWGRLRAHRGSRSGTGNHRGSIFRLHVGAAMLARDRQSIATWGVGSSGGKPTRLAEAEHERQVSRYIGGMSVLYVDVSDEPGPNSVRSYIERSAIALLSNTLRPADQPSAGWLGLHSPNAAIRRSGLWNLNYVDSRHESRFLDVLEDLLRQTCAP